MRLSSFLSIVCLVIPAFLASCGGSRIHNATTHAEGDTIRMKYASNLTIIKHPDYTEAKIRNPWDTTKTLHNYILLAEESQKPDNLPDGIIVRTPVKNALIYSTVHNSLVRSLGALDAIGGICDAEYISDDSIKSRLKEGRIVDCGNSMSPNQEKIIQLRPSAIMLSPFENNDNYDKISKLGIPVIECADYMETSALGRAEWVIFYGILFGKEKEAMEMFADVESEYTRMKNLTASTKTRPVVIMDQRYGQVWDVPGGESTIAGLIRDAGGTNPFDSFRQSGSVPLSPEKVLADAHDADIWFVRYNQTIPKTLKELAGDAPVNSKFKAFKNKNVFGCNTRYVDFYGETPFHPEYLLGDFLRHIHPELKDSIKQPKTYYTRMQ